MKLIKAIKNWLYVLSASSQLEQHIRTHKPKSHAELERLVREYYSIRGL